MGGSCLGSMPPRLAASQGVRGGRGGPAGKLVGGGGPVGRDVAGSGGKLLFHDGAPTAAQCTSNTVTIGKVN